ncbi:MAG: efflux RND transporter periplasmic adaptor subunit, partial [Terriglobales bacterium]
VSGVRLKPRASRLVPRLLIAAVLITVAAVGVRAGIAKFKPAEKQLPTARVKRGTLEVKVYSTGELRATQSVSLMAPPVVGGGALQIVSLMKTGTRVKPGDIVLEFDPSEQQYKLEQARSEVAEAEQQIAKSKADAVVSAAQDKVSLLKARFDVRRAELDVSRNELLSAIDAQKNVLALDEAKRRLAQLEQDTKSRVASNQASLAVVEEKRNKSQLTMQQAQQAIESLKVKTALAGVVSIKDNTDAMGGIMFPGIVLPEYREGDVVRPGRVVAEVLETNDMEVNAKLTENDRANVSPGERVEVRIDAYPGLVLPGHVKSVAGVATSNMFSPDGTRKFEASFKIDTPDPRLRSGQSAQITVAGQEIKDALFLPRQALFDKDGRPVLYVRKGDGFEQREVKITHRTESQITIEGLKEGEEVALVDPEKAARGEAGAPQPAMTGGGR